MYFTFWYHIWVLIQKQKSRDMQAIEMKYLRRVRRISEKLTNKRVTDSSTNNRIY